MVDQGVQMSQKVQHFLLVFDHEQGRLIDLKEFGCDGDLAVSEYSAKEQELKDRELIIGSDSLATVKLTHANYFDGSASVSQYLVGI